MDVTGRHIVVESKLVYFVEADDGSGVALHELHYLDIENPHHFKLDLDQLDRIFEHRFLQSKSFSFPVTCVEIEYMFDTLGFL